MKTTTLAIIAALLIAGCGNDPAPARVTATYHADETPGPCVAGYCATRRMGHGTATNSGESVAYDVRIRIKTACEDFSVGTTPRNIAPGQSATYETGLYFGCSADSVIVTWGE